jgi:hypothetical protein
MPAAEQQYACADALCMMLPNKITLSAQWSVAMLPLTALLRHSNAYWVVNQICHP